MTEKNYPLMMLVIAAIVGLVVGYAVSQMMVAGPLNSQANAQLANTQAQLSSTQSQLAKMQAEVSSMKSTVTDLQAQVQTLTAQDAADKAALTQANLNIFSKADVFDLKFHDLLQEHDFELIAAVRRSLNTSNPAFPGTLIALQTTVDEVAAQISFVYGNATAMQFHALWDRKLNAFLNYTTNLNTQGNPAANVQFASDMGAYENASVQFWTSINPYISQATITNDVSNHVNSVKSAIDFWNIADYTDYFIALHNSYTQMGVFADDLAVAMIKQHPELFS